MQRIYAEVGMEMRRLSIPHEPDHSKEEARIEGR
jgi:hypothetical protein